MILTITFFICFYPIALILYFVMRNEAKPKKNLLLGITLPHDARRSDDVQTVLKTFRHQESIIMAVLTLAILPVFILNNYSIILLWYFVWLIAAIGLPGVPFIVNNKKLKALKVKNGWYGESTGVTLVDTKLAVTPKKALSVWWFVPAAAITLVPVVQTLITLRGRDEFWPMMSVFLTFFVLSAVFYFLYRIIFRQRAEVVDGDTSTNAALTQIRRYNWGKSFLLIAWLTAVFDILFWLFLFNALAVLIMTVIYTVILIAFLMQAEFKTRKMQQKLTENSGTAVYTDDDDKWLLGMFYNNPNDKHFMVNKRTGIGMTMNMAKAPAKILMGFVVLILLSMPLIGLWLMREESTPVSLSVDGTQLTAGHTGTVYELVISDIESVYLLDALPSGGIRTNGTALKTVLKGKWRFDGIGSCRLCLNPQVPPFIVAQTTDRIYIFGSNTATDTRTVYQELLSLGIPSGALRLPASQISEGG